MGRRLIELILAIKRKCQGTEERIQAELGLSPAEFNGLTVLDETQEVSGCEFAGRMTLSPSRGSRVLNRLVSDGYVRTRVSPEDRRTILVALTPAGRQVKQQIIGHMDACEQRIYAGLDPQSAEQVESALEILDRVL